MYRLIREHRDGSDCQVLVATHSGRLIDEAGNEGKLYAIREDGLKRIRREDARKLLNVPYEHIVHSGIKRYVLYLEGKSDLDILREWAKVLDHPALRYLEEPFWVATAEECHRHFVRRHYQALKAQVPTLRALEVRDRNGNEDKRWRGLERGKLRIDRDEGKIPNGMALAFWSRYEIENYLIHPGAVSRFVLSSSGREGAEKAKTYMEEYLPPILFERSFEATAIDRIKGKTIISRVLSAAGYPLGEAEYYRIASVMKPGEAHPDIVAMLDEVERICRNS